MTILKSFGSLLDGTAGDDVMVGFGNGTVLRGGAGDDVLVATYGNETLVGGKGSDLLIGGSGNDLLVGGDAGVPSAVPDTMAGGMGNDTYYVENPGDVIINNAGEGVDTEIVFNRFYAMSVNDHATFLRGYDGDHELVGNSFDNRIVGGNGNDTINGGMGNDSLAGGVGFNLFEFSPNSGQDTITDYRGLGLDRIGLSPLLHITSANFDSMVSITPGPAATTVRFTGTTDTIRILNAPAGLQIGGITKADFLFEH